MQNVEQLAQYLKRGRSKRPPKGKRPMPINPLQQALENKLQPGPGQQPVKEMPQQTGPNHQNKWQQFLKNKKGYGDVTGGPARIQRGQMQDGNVWGKPTGNKTGAQSPSSYNDFMEQMKKMKSGGPAQIQSRKFEPGQMPPNMKGDVWGKPTEELQGRGKPSYQDFMEQMKKMKSGGPADIQSGRLERGQMPPYMRDDVWGRPSGEPQGEGRSRYQDFIEQMRKRKGDVTGGPADINSGGKLDEMKDRMREGLENGGPSSSSVPDFDKLLNAYDFKDALRKFEPGSKEYFDFIKYARQKTEDSPDGVHNKLESDYEPTSAEGTSYYGNKADIDLAKRAGVTGNFVDLSKMSDSEKLEALKNGGVVLGGSAAAVGDRLWNQAVSGGAQLDRVSGKNREETLKALRGYQGENEFEMPDVTERYSGNRTYFGNSADIDLAKQAGLQGKFVNVEGMDRNEVLNLMAAGGVVLGGTAGGINERDFERALSSGADLTRVGGKDRDETLELMRQYQKDSNLNRSLDHITDLLSNPYEYDPENDHVYKAMMQIAQKQAGAASKDAMETMNDRGIMSSSMMGERLGQIQQGASDAVIGQIPQLAQNAQNQHNTQVSQLMGLQGALQGQANNERDFDESHNRWFDEFTDSKDRWNKEFNESHNRWDTEFKEGKHRWDKEFNESNSRWDSEFGLNKDKFNWDKHTWGEEFEESNRRYDLDSAFRDDQFEFQKEQTEVENAFKERGYELQDLARQDDWAYKEYLMDMGISEQEAKGKTNEMVAAISKFDSAADAFGFVAEQAGNIADSGVDMRTVYDAIDAKFGSSGSSGGGGYGSANFTSEGKGGGWIPNTSDGKYKVTSEYGHRNDPFSGKKKHHGGTDIALPVGTKLSSNVQGTVVYAGMGKSGTGYGGYGNVVAVRDFKGNVHLYAHLDGVNVKKGQKVNAGDLLGKSGNTGKSTGPHLHYEVRKNGDINQKMDPSPYLRGGFSKSSSGPRKTSSSRRSYDPYTPNSRQQRQAGGNVMSQSASVKAPSSVQKYISTATNKYKVSPALVTAVMKAESNFNPNAKSHAGAYGLMQLMPLWGSGRNDPQTNVNIGTKFLRDNLKKYPDVRLALAAYNWGPGNVDKAIKKAGKKSYAAIEKYLPQETKKYVPKVLGFI